MKASTISEILVGTYEDYVVGYQFDTFNHVPSSRKKMRIDKGPTKHSNHQRCPLVHIEQSFAVRGHSGSVRCLSARADGTLVLSAGQDEMINLFSLKKRKLLHTFEAAITCAAFVGKSHLLCGSDDGNIYIYECKSTGINLVKTLKGHKGGVTSLSVHPTEKILLTLSRDKTMRTWNLIKGRCAYVTNIRAEAHIVKWSKLGDEFLVAANTDIYLYNQQGKLKRRITLQKRVNYIEFLNDTFLVVATDSGNLEFFNNTTTECLPVMVSEAHESRIKSIKCLTRFKSDVDSKNRLSEAESLRDTRFVTASSDGSVKIWSLHIAGDTVSKPIELANVNLGARITCMTATVRHCAQKE